MGLKPFGVVGEETWTFSALFSDSVYGSGCVFPFGTGSVLVNSAVYLSCFCIRLCVRKNEFDALVKNSVRYSF